MSQPNVILITPGQFHADALSGAENSTVRTPHLDRLADEGTRFSNCHVHNRVCTPSRATLVTGAHPSVHGAVFNDMQADTRLATVAGKMVPIELTFTHFLA
jgi:arylsulfatase A-like enzyme